MQKLLLISILIIAVVLRVLFLDKPSGLWYDELLIYNQAVSQGLMGVVKNVFENDVHLPLYQICLHYWGNLVSFSDFSLRLFSVICGVLTVIAAYFIGNKKQGLICMLLFAINSFLIYYSQEVKMYELLALFSTLNLIALININNNGKGYVSWVLSSLAMIFTYTTSIIYVVIQVIVFCVYKRSKKFIISSFILAVLNLPLVAFLILNHKKYSTFITGFYTDYSSLFVAMQNFFTPKLIGLQNNPIHYFQSFYNDINFYSLGLVVLPMGIAIYFIYNALKEEKFNCVIFSSAMLFVLTQVLLFQFANFNILSRYLILILPNFLVLIALGFDFKKFSTFILLIFIGVNLTYLGYASSSAFKIGRVGFKYVGQFINSQADNGDIIVLWNRADILNKYMLKKLRGVSILQDFSYSSEIILEQEDTLNKLSLPERKDKLRTYFINPVYPQNTVKTFSIICNSMDSNDKIFIIISSYFDNFTRESFVKDIADNSKYNEMTYNNLLTIHSLLNLKQLCDENLTYIATENLGDFVVYVYKK